MKVKIVSCFENWYTRLRFVERFFVDRGDEVQTIISDFIHSEKKPRTDFEYHVNPKIVHAPRYKKNLSFGRLYSHFSFSKNVYNELKAENDIDLIYVMIPANSLVYYLDKYKAKHKNVRIIIDIYDMWPESLEGLVGVKKIIAKPVFGLWRKIRNDNLKCADYIFTECDLYRERLDDKIRNISNDVLYATKKQTLKMHNYTPSDAIRLCYVGSLNNLIDVDKIVLIAETINRRKHVVFNIIGDGISRQQLLDKLQENNIESVFYGKVYDENMKASIYAKSDFGINIMKDGLCIGLTQKSIEYFEAGLPVINSIKHDTWDLVERYNAGINVDFENEKYIIDSIDRIINSNLEILRVNTKKLFDDNFSEKGIYNKLNKALEVCMDYKR